MTAIEVALFAGMPDRPLHTGVASKPEPPFPWCPLEGDFYLGVDLGHDPLRRRMRHLGVPEVAPGVWEISGRTGWITVTQWNRGHVGVTTHRGHFRDAALGVRPEEHDEIMAILRWHWRYMEARP